MDPRATTLGLPEPYGRVTRTLAWPEVRGRLEQAMRYWLVTVGPGGRPHVVPVEGLWLDDVWFYGGDKATRHLRNVLADPRAAMHLPDPDAAVMVEGDARPSGASDALAWRLAEASRAKYGYGDPALAKDSFALVPRRVRAWSSFPADCTRFDFT